MSAQVFPERQPQQRFFDSADFRDDDDEPRYDYGQDAYGDDGCDRLPLHHGGARDNCKESKKLSTTGLEGFDADAFLEAYTASQDALLLIPRCDVISVPSAETLQNHLNSSAGNKNHPNGNSSAAAHSILTKLQLCPRFDASNADRSTCTQGAACRFVHASTANAVSHAIHVNYLWRSLQDVVYERFPDSIELSVSLPNEHHAAHALRGGLCLRTRALESNRKTLSHCAHYYFNRTCNRGPMCSFVHAVSTMPAHQLGSGNPVLAKDDDRGERRQWGRTQQVPTWLIKKSRQIQRDQRFAKKQPPPTHTRDNCSGAAAGAGAAALAAACSIDDVALPLPHQHRAGMPQEWDSPVSPNLGSRHTSFITAIEDGVHAQQQPQQQQQHAQRSNNKGQRHPRGTGQPQCALSASSTTQVPYLNTPQQSWSNLNTHQDASLSPSIANTYLLQLQHAISGGLDSSTNSAAQHGLYRNPQHSSSLGSFVFAASTPNGGASAHLVPPHAAPAVSPSAQPSPSRRGGARGPAARPMSGLAAAFNFRDGDSDQDEEGSAAAPPVCYGVFYAAQQDEHATPVVVPAPHPQVAPLSECSSYVSSDEGVPAASTPATPAVAGGAAAATPPRSATCRRRTHNPYSRATPTVVSVSPSASASPSPVVDHQRN